MTVAASVIISLGVVPLCVGTCAEAKGMEAVSQACRTIACCSLFLVTVRGGIMIVIPFLLSKSHLTCSRPCEQRRRRKSNFQSRRFDDWGETSVMFVRRV